MKRSEMIRIISDTMWGEAFFEHAGECTILASKILTNIQLHGMMPPPFNDKDLPFANATYEWEPE